MRKLSRKRKVKRKRVSKRKVMRGGKKNKSQECGGKTRGYCLPDKYGRERVCDTQQHTEGNRIWHCRYRSSEEQTRIQNENNPPGYVS